MNNDDGCCIVSREIDQGEFLVSGNAQINNKIIMSQFMPSSINYSSPLKKNHQEGHKSMTPKKMASFPTNLAHPPKEDLHSSQKQCQSPRVQSNNYNNFTPASYPKQQPEFSARLFNSNHLANPRFNPEYGTATVNRVHQESPTIQQMPPKYNKSRKVSQNNIIFETKLGKQQQKKDSSFTILTEKERRGSFNGPFMSNYQQKKPRFSMSGPEQLQMISERREKKIKNKWTEDNQFSMEQKSTQQVQRNTSFGKDHKEVFKERKISRERIPSKQRKYSDNAHIKKAPSFLSSPRIQEPRAHSAQLKSKLSIQRFKIIKQLGKGAYGRVVLALQRESGFICAIKILSKQDIRDENMVEQFSRQIKIQCYFNHPNIVKVYGYFDDLLHLYIIMECAIDQRLSDVLQQHLLTQKQAATVFFQLCSAVGALHADSVIHRDLKPENVMLHEGVVKVCDFGWSVFRGSKLRTTFCGTPLYLSPQILIGDSYDQSVDVWALGIILYECLLGQGPFRITRSEDLTRILHQKIDLSGSNLSIDLKGIIEACLCKKSEDRASVKWLLNHEWAKKGRPDEARRFTKFE